MADLSKYITNIKIAIIHDRTLPVKNKTFTHFVVAKVKHHHLIHI